MTRTRIPLSVAEEEARRLQERLEMSTAEIGLTVRTTNCLEERGIFTVRDLLNCTREDLLAISNFGEKTLEEVYLALETFGFYRSSRPAKSRDSPSRDESSDLALPGPCGLVCVPRFAAEIGVHLHRAPRRQAVQATLRSATTAGDGFAHFSTAWNGRRPHCVGNPSRSEMSHLQRTFGAKYRPLSPVLGGEGRVRGRVAASFPP